MANTIVCKFGGTSMATASSMRQAASIVRSDETRRFVIVSAPGARFRGDIKITDLLINGKFDEVKKRFEELASNLNLKIDCSFEFDAAADKNFAASRGEYYSAKLMAPLLGFEFLDAKDVIVFDKNANVDLTATQKQFDSVVKADSKYVIPGFYGADKIGKIITFPRGGSDISGAIIACCANAKVYENWTDVNGIYTADPNKTFDSKKIDTMTYDELKSLGTVTVLHQACALYTVKKKIPINIRNTFAPDDSGTMIS